MKLIVQKSVLSGEVPIPGSKSHTIRALAIAALAGGVSTIRNPLVSDDTLSAVTCYRALGAKIDTVDTTKWLITGTAGQPARPAEPIDVGNSGTTLRIAAASAALAGADEQNPIILTGDAQIQSRPIGPLLTALTDLGAQATALKGNGKAPIAVCSRLAGGKTTIECTTSQYLSSLLLAAPLAETDTEIQVSLLNEPDYVQMTLDWLDRQGIEYENDDMQQFRIRGGQKYKAFDVAIAADFSSATFFFCAAALTAPLGGHVKLTGLDFSDSQPDKAVADYLRRMGADIRIESDGTYVGRSALKGIEIDMNRTPDALPAMAVTAAFADGETRLVNVPQARNKETDRIASMADELKKMGAGVEELPDGLIIQGNKLNASAVDGRSDHRIVMAMAVAAMAIEGETTIDTAEAMNVTFPDFVDLMQGLGANMTLQ